MSPESAFDGLVALFGREGYDRIEPPVLQPAEVFLDLSGEDIRRRMFVTVDAAGRELCLRPEYTIPVCREHLRTGAAEATGYAYLGPVFRLRAGETGEFLQAGLELIGRRDAGAADAEILALALEGLATLGHEDVAVRLGDMGLLSALTDALGLAPALKRRLVRSVAGGRGLDGVAAPNGEAAGNAALLAALEGQAPETARAVVEDILSIAGISRVGGRSAAEIAERFLDRAAQRTGLPKEAARILRAYLAIDGDPDAAANAVRGLARDAGLPIEAALAAFEERIGFMAVRGLDVGGFRFAADFARNLDYYTGFIFELHDPARADNKPLVGGGRYDGLLEQLGAPAPVPAVGCSFWLDRMGGPR